MPLVLHIKQTMYGIPSVQQHLSKPFTLAKFPTESSPPKPNSSAPEYLVGRGLAILLERGCLRSCEADGLALFRDEVMARKMGGEAGHWGRANGLLDRRSFHKVSMKKRKEFCCRGRGQWFFTTRPKQGTARYEWKLSQSGMTDWRWSTYALHGSEHAESVRMGDSLFDSRCPN